MGLLRVWREHWNFAGNRYGTLLPDRPAAEEALSFLLGPHGPFADVIFQPMRMVRARQITPGIDILQASWSAPALGPNGRPAQSLSRYAKLQSQ